MTKTEFILCLFLHTGTQFFLSIRFVSYNRVNFVNNMTAVSYTWYNGIRFEVSLVRTSMSFRVMPKKVLTVASCK